MLLIGAGCAPAAQPAPTPTFITTTPLPAWTPTPSPIPPTATPTLPAVTATPVDFSGQINAPDGFVELRFMPQESGEVARIVNNLAPLTVNGRSADSQWLQVTFPDGFTGWIQAGYVTHTLDITLLAVIDSAIAITRPAPDVDAMVQGDINALRLRDNPNTTGNVQTYLTADTALRIIGRTKDNKWVQVVTPESRAGWVLSTYLHVYVNLDEVPVTGVSPSVNFAHNAEVSRNGDHLRLRSQPSLVAEINANLAQLTPVNAVGRTSDNQWLQVQTPDYNQGWVSASYVDLFVDVNTLPVTGQTIVAAIGAPFGPGIGAYDDVITGITSTTRQIYRRGQQLGNKPNVFSKVGDSITEASFFLTPLGADNYALHDHAYLQPVVDYFLQGRVRGADPFENVSLAAAGGSTTDGVLNPRYADDQWCQAGESQLECEYRVAKPAIALIMFGTNDVIWVPLPDGFRERLNRIVDVSVDMGVIPVLSTVPDRQGYEEQIVMVNQIIVETARRRGVPLWDYAAALDRLPNRGLASDGVHPSMPPYDTSPADFTAENLQYGFIVRNLTALQVLDALWRNVILPG